jgi:lysophospholipase L1-like esterase
MMFPSSIAFGSATFPSTAAFPATPKFGCDLFVFEGDSLTADNGAGIVPYPACLKVNHWGAKGGFINKAANGRFISEMLTQMPLAEGYAANALGRKYFFIMGGTNGIGDGISVASMTSDLLSCWTLARAAGYLVVAFCVMKQVGLTAPDETDRTALNDYIIANSVEYDFLCRPDLEMPDPADTDLFYDGTHLTQLGCDTFAAHVADVLDL